MSNFSIKVRVYYEDTDAGGIVYNANYVKFLERARTEWLRSFSIQQDELMKRDVAFVVKHLDLDFVAPARFNELIDVTCELKRAGAASIVFSQSITDSAGRTLVNAEVKIACVSLSGMRPVAIPEDVKEVIIRGS
jgi:acyl-CoA thioester hydrolase